MHKRALLALLYTACLLVLGCGGGGGGEEGPNFGVLEGTWLGRTTGGSLQLTFDADGGVTQVLRNGIDAGETGAVVQISGPYFVGAITGGAEFRLFLDETGSYALFLGDPFLAALQKGATTIPPGAVALSDISPAAWAGTNFAIDGALNLLNPQAAAATIDAAGMLAGTDAAGLTFGSPPGQPLEATGTYFFGPYRDSAHPTTGGIDLVASPDNAFLAVAAFPEQNTIITNAAFVAAWSRQ